MTSIAVAVSGGVDSLCALLRLKQAGHSVIAIHGLFLPDAAPPPGLEESCRKAGAEVIIADFRRQFHQEVIERFRREYAKGLTPNPCAICNCKIKFGALLDFALAAGAEKLATGHYGSIDTTAFPAPVWLECNESGKDQTYFLSLVNSDALEKVLLPLGSQTKMATRREVQAAGISVPVQSESQDVCFIQKYGENVAHFNYVSGPVLLRTAADINCPPERLPEIGRHNGLGRYTLGQRRGLQIAWKMPLYVREIDYLTNTLVVAPRSLLEMGRVIVKQINFFVDPEKWPDLLFARLRYRQKLIRCDVEIRGSEIQLELQDSCFSSAPGQICALYDRQGHILAGGVIDTVFHRYSE